ncbi:MAG TPA: hypothetical protein VGK20_17690 [Candidatus Binatia bacterium]|jgi:hypothetical protein
MFDHSRFNGLAAVATGAMLALVPGRAAAMPQYNVLRQLTHITTGTIDRVKLRSQDGADLAFVSNGDVMGPGTQTAHKQIYVWREQLDGTGVMTQVTNGSNCDSTDVSRPSDTVQSDRPEVVAFTSTCDLDPSIGNADHNPEIFFYELDSGLFHQITNTVAPADNREPFLSDSGRCMVFRSNGNLDNNTPANPYYDPTHPGPHFSNADGSTEVFLYAKLNFGPAYPQDAVFTQVSSGPSGTTSSHPVINGYYFPRQCDTTAYQSDYDQLGTGFTGQGIYIYKMGSSSLLPITAAEIPQGFPDGIYRNPSISGASPTARGPHVVFESEPDLWRNGSSGTNIFDWRDFHPRMTQFTDVGGGFTATEPEVGDGGGVIATASNGELISQEHTLRTGEMPPFNGDANSEIFLIQGRNKVFQVTQTTGCNNLHPSMKGDGDRVSWISDCDIVGQNGGEHAQIYLWSLERDESPLAQPNGCLESDGCCIDAPQMTTCYHTLRGAKPKIARPSCIDRPNGCN